MLPIASINFRRNRHCSFSSNCFNENQVDAINGISAEEGVGHVLNSSLNKTQTKQVFDDIKVENQATLCSTRKFGKRRIS